MNGLFFILVLLNTGCVSTATNQSQSTVHPDHLPRVHQRLVEPPFLPQHDQVARGGPMVAEVHLVAEEKEIELGDGSTAPGASAHIQVTANRMTI